MKIFKLFLFFALFFASCQKDVTVQQTSTPNGTLSKEESAKLLLTETETFGNLVYDHVKFRFLSHKASDYVNPAIREATVKEAALAEEAAIAALEAEFRGD